MNGSFCKKVVSKAKVALNFSHFESPSMKKINFRLSRKNKTVDFAKKRITHCTFLCLPSLLLLKTTILIVSVEENSNSHWATSRYYNRKYVIYYCNQKLDVRKNDSSPEFFPSWLYSPPTKLIVILCAVPFQDRSTETNAIYIHNKAFLCFLLFCPTFLFFFSLKIRDKTGEK